MRFSTALPIVGLNSSLLMCLFLVSFGSSVNAQISTATSVSASPSPSLLGQNVTITATIDAGGKTAPTGNMDFTDGATALGSSALSKSALGIAKIAAGGYHTCAIANNGRVYCWGLGSSGQLGQGAYSDSNTPVAVIGITNAIDVAVGGAHSCAILADGTVRCWGSDSSGQLGQGTMSTSNTPVEVQRFGTATSISAGVDFTCAHVPGVNSVYCWGSNANGQLGTGTTGAGVPYPQRVFNSGSVVQIASGGYHSCMLTSVGDVRCWGKGTDNQLGYGSAADSATPVEVRALDGFTEAGTGNEFFFQASQITAGNAHSCAVVPNPSSATSARVYCWGRNDSGQLGRDPALTSLAIPEYTSRYARPAIHWSGSSYYTGAATLGAGFAHTCVRQVNDYILCFGEGSSGQIGNNDTTDTYAPAAIAPISGVADNFVQVAVGNSHGCGLRSTGQVDCWGQGTAGQLGRGNNTAVNIRPDVVPNFDVLTVSTASLSVSTLTTGSHTLGASFAANGTHNASSGTVDHTVNKGSQTITFTSSAPTAAVIGGTAYTPTATASSTLTVTFSIDATSAAVCALSGGDVSFTGAGTCKVNADQAGDASFDPAPQVAQSFEVNKITQTITFNQPSNQTYSTGGSVPLPASASSALAVTRASATPGVCTISGASALILGSGTCSVTVSQAGNATYAAATSVTRSFTIAKGTQTISFAQPASQTFSTGKLVALPATASSGLAVTRVSATPGVCTISGGSALLVGVGNCLVTVSQAGNANFNPAVSVARSFAVTKGPQTITFSQPADQVYLAGKLVPLPATASSGLAVTRVSLTPAVCVISGTSARILGPGQCGIEIRQAGNVNFQAATPATRYFEVNLALGAEASALAPSARAHEQKSAAVAPFGAGAVMVYASRSTATGPFGILRQNLLFSGAPNGAPTVVTAPSVGVGEPDVAALTAGQIVVWQGLDGSGPGIRAQRYSAAGAPVGAAFQVNAVAPGSQIRPRVAALPSGGFVVVWDTAILATDQDVMMRVFNAAGTAVTGDIRVNTTLAGYQNMPAVAVLASGTIAVTWASETTPGRYGVMHRLYTAAGAPLTGQLVTAALNQTLPPTPVIAARTGAGASGGFAVAYADSEGATSPTPADIAVKTITAAGVAAATTTKANSVTLGHQSRPTIAPLKGGAFVVGFETADGSSNGIGLRLFSTVGVPLGTEDVGNAITALAQGEPALTPIGPVGAGFGDTFLGAWTSRSPVAANNTDIAARRYQGP